jgi:peptidoglycan/LPS O-acetylase OafA/YrhL
MNTKTLSPAILSPDILKSKQHFEILDGLRGVAALAIVVFHFMEMAISDFSKNFIAHGFLAVDFFFCLSGFVIGYAYDDRIKKMGVIEFFKSRLIRLHPLVILGTVVGLLSFLFDPFGGQPEAYSAGKIFLIFMSSILLIPFPVIEERSFNLFGLNAPSWSLFWEYVANIVYAFILYKVGRHLLLFLTIIAAAALCFVGYNAGSLLGGWAGVNFWDGGARILYSFLAGLLIYRSNWIIKSKLGFAGLTLLLMIAFLVPFTKWSWVTQLITVLFYFPLLVALGAGAQVSQGLKKLCDFSGRISYPLYMTHYMAIWIFYNYYNTYKPGTTQLTVIVIAGTMLLIGFAYLVMVFYDEPVRKYLNEKRKKG